MNDDRGLELERRAHRIVWSMGYFARRDVLIYSEDSEQITDIDVIGIKFDNTLAQAVIIVETKSEKGFSSILKLRGLVDYYSPNTNALLIRPNVTPAIIKFALQLGIKAMHTSRLEEMEDELLVSTSGTSLTYSPNFDKEYTAAVKSLLNSRFKKEVMLRDFFWFEENPFHKLKVYKEAIEGLKSYGVKDSDSALALLLVELTTFFSVSLLQCCGNLYALPEHQRRAVFFDKLVSGKLSSKEKKELIDKTYLFMTKYSKSVLNAPLVLRKEDFVLFPNYSEQLFDLANRLLKKSNNARDIPRLFDIYLSCIALSKKPTLKDLQENLRLAKDDFDITVKFTRDIIAFLFEKEIPEVYQYLMKE